MPLKSNFDKVDLISLQGGIRSVIVLLVFCLAGSIFGLVMSVVLLQGERKVRISSSLPLRYVYLTVT